MDLMAAMQFFRFLCVLSILFSHFEIQVKSWMNCQKIWRFILHLFSLLLKAGNLEMILYFWKNVSSIFNINIFIKAVVYSSADCEIIKKRLVLVLQNYHEFSNFHVLKIKTNAVNSRPRLIHELVNSLELAYLVRASLEQSEKSIRNFMRLSCDNSINFLSNKQSLKGF